MLEKVQSIFSKLPEMDQHILMGMYNPKAELSQEGQRLRTIIDQMPEWERAAAVGGEKAEPDGDETKAPESEMIDS